MKVSIIAFLISFLIVYPVSADSKMELVDKYMELTKLESTLQQYRNAYTNEAKRTYKNVPQSFWVENEYEELMKKYESGLWEGWRDAFYNYLTVQELEELLAFLETDIGKKFLKMNLDLEPIFTKVSTQNGADLNDGFVQLVSRYNSR